MVLVDRALPALTPMLSKQIPPREKQSSESHQRQTGSERHGKGKASTLRQEFLPSDHVGQVLSTHCPVEIPVWKKRKKKIPVWVQEETVEVGPVL